MNRRAFGGRVFRLAAMLTTFAASAVLVGCDGADQSDGSPVARDEDAVKRQSEMSDFYKQNPLNKSKAKSKK